MQVLVDDVVEGKQIRTGEILDSIVKQKTDKFQFLELRSVDFLQFEGSRVSLGVFGFQNDAKVSEANFFQVSIAYGLEKLNKKTLASLQVLEVKIDRNDFGILQFTVLFRAKSRELLGVSII